LRYDWDKGSHPGYALARWLQEFREQVLLFTRDFTVQWTSNAAERADKAGNARRNYAGMQDWNRIGGLLLMECDLARHLGYLLRRRPADRRQWALRNWA
jgi:hypothetical protein